MKKMIMAVGIMSVGITGIAWAEEASPAERTVNVAVQGTKNTLGLALKGIHVVFHGAESIVDIGIGLAHSGLKVLEIPFSNGKPLVDES